jgi:hypothetical protein
MGTWGTGIFADVPGAGAGGFMPNSLVNTNDLDRVAGFGYGFGPRTEGRR